LNTEEEPGRCKLALVRNKVLLRFSSPYQDDAGPSGWHGWIWPMKQGCLESCCDVWLSQKSSSVDKGFCGVLGVLTETFAGPGAAVKLL